MSMEAWCDMIRKFLKEDIGVCVKDFIETFNAPPWNEHWKIERAEETIRDIFHSPKFVGFVLEENGEKIAYALCQQKYWYNSDDRRKLMIEIFFVKPNFQQRGYGEKLLGDIEKYTVKNNLRAIALFTKNDIPAFDFYRNNGFVVLENLPYMYKIVT